MSVLETQGYIYGTHDVDDDGSGSGFDDMALTKVPREGATQLKLLKFCTEFLPAFLRVFWQDIVIGCPFDFRSFAQLGEEECATKGRGLFDQGFRLT